MSNGDDINDEPGDDSSANRGGSIFATVFAAAVLAAILIGIGYLYSANSQGSQSSSGGPPMCRTSCLGVVLVECPGGRYMGTCFGVNLCSDPVHVCGTNPQ